MNFATRAAELKEAIIAHRHYLHQHAELSFQEKETTAYLVEQLTKLGIPVQSFDDYTGCIATIQGWQPGKTVLLRADIDALPIQENSGVEFESIHPGIMHACGHDCHASMLLGAAQLLWEQREQLKGTVKLLFQAAEEVFVGSHYYWDKGYLSDVDAAMGMHVWPTVDSGKLCVQDGPLMASCDNFKITVHGVSAHGSQPHNGRDAIVAASAIICNLQTIVSRINDPLNSLVVSVGTIKAGTQFNIITDTAVMEGTVRAHTTEARSLVEENMRRIVDATALAMGCTAEIEYNYLEPPVRNDDLALNKIAREAAKTLYGEDVLRSTALATGSEDFSYIMEKIPSSMFVFLGCRDEETGCVYPVHNEKFKINENILPAGAAEYAQFAADYLDKHAGGAGK
ncbi:amidohydrolase [Flavonifractor sp. An100]|uniref:M20 metallopeptidase family protein n=1 Tax=Flavonifractor sp. An100 TaxID=1965538 RepID=UPI000B3A42FB|nr:amidohydrolase [Flavonifractor sp. An100]OUQ76167.1 amidohydrolase [Flavonifractor sp. An100]